MNATRLLKLARHLEKGKLGHKRFDFWQYNNVCEPKCGTAGCAVGECPIVWPKLWTFNAAYGEPSFDGLQAHRSSMIFFGLTWGEAEHLFVPQCQNETRYGGRKLGVRATKEQVAANIRDFVRHQRKQKKIKR